MSRASKNVYHPNGDANNFTTVEAALDGLQFGATAKIGGDVGATDNQLVRTDGTGGKTVQGSAITVDDSGNISGVGTVNSNPVFSTATAAQYQGNTSGAKALTPVEVWNATAYTALTDGTTIAVDMATGFNFSVSIAGNRTLSNPSNVKMQAGKFKITASGGTRTIDVGSNFKKTADISFPVSIASGQTAFIYYDVDDSTHINITAVLNNPA